MQHRQHIPHDSENYALATYFFAISSVAAILLLVQGHLPHWAHLTGLVVVVGGIGFGGLAFVLKLLNGLRDFICADRTQTAADAEEQRQRAAAEAEEQRRRAAIEAEEQHRRDIAKAADRMLFRMVELRDQRRSTQFTVEGLATDGVLDLAPDLAQEAMDLLRSRGAVDCAGGLYFLTQR